MVIAISDLDAILLDLDGTILDTTEELCHAVATAANRMAVPSLLPLHHTDIITKYPNLFGGPLEEFHDTIIAPHYQNNDDNNDGDNNDNDDNGDINNNDERNNNNKTKGKPQYNHAQSTQQFIQHFLTAISSSNQTPPHAFPDVLPTLLHLHKTYPSLLFAVATTKPSSIAEQDLTSHSIPPTLRPLLTHVQGTDQGIAPKPSPDVLLKCARVLGVEIRRTVYVGDTRRDALAAKAAGCVACLTVRRGEEGNLDGLGADGLIHGFGEIEGALGDIVVMEQQPLVGLRI